MISPNHNKSNQEYQFNSSTQQFCSPRLVKTGHRSNKSVSEELQNIQKYYINTKKTPKPIQQFENDINLKHQQIMENRKKQQISQNQRQIQTSQSTRMVSPTTINSPQNGNFFNNNFFKSPQNQAKNNTNNMNLSIESPLKPNKSFRNSKNSNNIKFVQINSNHNKENQQNEGNNKYISININKISYSQLPSNINLENSQQKSSSYINEDGSQKQLEHNHLQSKQESQQDLNSQQNSPTKDQGNNQATKTAYQQRQLIKKREKELLQESQKLEKTILNKSFSQKYGIMIRYESHRQHKTNFLAADRSYIYFCIDSLPAINQIKDLCEICCKQYKNKICITPMLDKMIKIAQETKIIYLQLLVQKLVAKISFHTQDYIKAIQMAKNIKNQAQNYQIHFFKIACYKLIGKGFLSLNKFSISIIYFVKLLRYSWMLNSTNIELQAYDLLGLAYYNKGDLQLAMHYHQKMIKGELEIDGLRNQKEVSTSKLKQRIYSNNPVKKFNQQRKIIEGEGEDDHELVSSSDDEFELAIPVITSSSFFKSNQDSQQTFKLKQQPENTNKFAKKGEDLTWHDRMVRAKLNQLMRKQMPAKKDLYKAFYKKEVDEQFLSTQFAGKKSIKINDIKFVTHQTPNRVLSKYNEQVDPQLTKSNTYQYYDRFQMVQDKAMISKIIRLLNKFKKNLASAEPELQKTVQEGKSRLQNDSVKQTLGFKKFTKAKQQVLMGGRMNFKK